MGQQHAIHKFVLGTKDFDDKRSEFMYDKGWKKERLTPEERKRQREERYEKKREQNREHHRI